jgi:hypothetical protein
VRLRTLWRLTRVRLSLDDLVTHHKTTDDVVVIDQRNRQVPSQLDAASQAVTRPTAGYRHSLT